MEGLNQGEAKPGRHVVNSGRENRKNVMHVDKVRRCPAEDLRKLCSHARGIYRSQRIPRSTPPGMRFQFGAGSLEARDSVTVSGEQNVQSVHGLLFSPSIPVPVMDKKYFHLRESLGVSVNSQATIATETKSIVKNVG